MDEYLLHHLVQGLTQLASLSKPVLASEEEEKTFLVNFVAGVLNYISSRCVCVCVIYSLPVTQLSVRSSTPSYHVERVPLSSWKEREREST